jgi:hypothetical protein
MIRICHSGKNPTMRYLNRAHQVGVSWPVAVFGLPNINIYKIDNKLQAADVGTKRITCLNTCRSNCVLNNLIEPDVSPTDQRALLSTLRRETVDKLHTRDEEQRIRALERLESYTSSTTCARGGNFQKTKSQKKKRVKTNKVMCDDPATDACLCCEDYDVDPEPDYPCEDSREFDAWSEGDSEDNDDNMIPCDRVWSTLINLHCSYSVDPVVPRHATYLWIYHPKHHLSTKCHGPRCTKCP